VSDRGGHENVWSVRVGGAAAGAGANLPVAGGAKATEKTEIGSTAAELER
jgi:hypothetical protein